MKLERWEQSMIEEIYERIGGAAAVGSAVNKLYERLVNDSTVSHYFAHADLRNVKKHQRAFLAVALGGPEAYFGQDMVAAHAHMKISNAEFDVVANHLELVLVELEVSRADVSGVMAIIESQRADVVSGSLTPA